MTWVFHKFLARARIERDEVAVEPPKKQLAARIGNAPVVEPAAGRLLHVCGNLGRVLPFRRTVFRIEGVDVARPCGGGDEQRIAHH